MTVAGLSLMIGSEAGTLAKIEPFWSWNTPIAWTGFILFADGLVYRARGRSWLRSSPREFAWLALASIPLWLVFEFYNLFIDNWHYVGLPEQPLLRYFGYAWSFATIWPAIFEGTDLIGVIRRSGRAGGAGRPSREGAHVFYSPGPPGPPGPGDLPAPSIAAGVLMLTMPFLVPRDVAPYMAAPVWLGFIFLLDPINRRLGGASLWADLHGGRFDRVVDLGLSGLLCGGLWEFWNYWARAKWHYTVPIMERIKIFEMPLPGYLGFPAFALECFTMYVFVRTLLASAVRRTRAGSL